MKNILNYMVISTLLSTAVLIGLIYYFVYPEPEVYSIRPFLLTPILMAIIFVTIVTSEVIYRYNYVLGIGGSVSLALFVSVSLLAAFHEVIITIMNDSMYVILN